MEDLIKALQIFLKYVELENRHEPSYRPIACEHDVLYIMDIYPCDVSDEDKIELKQLGFLIDEDAHCFYSLRFGSA